MRYCRTCKQNLPRQNFEGRRLVCNDCRAKKDQEKRQRDKEREKRAREREHRFRINEAHRARIDRERHREYMRRKRRFARWCSRQDDIPPMRFYISEHLQPIPYVSITRSPFSGVFGEYLLGIRMPSETERPTDERIQDWIEWHDAPGPGRVQVGKAQLFMGESTFTYRRVLMGRRDDKNHVWVPLDMDWHHDKWLSFRHWENAMDSVERAMNVAATWRREADAIRDMPISKTIERWEKTYSWARTALFPVRTRTEKLKREMESARLDLFWCHMYPEVQAQLEDGIKSLRNYCIKPHIDKCHTIVEAAKIKKDADEWLTAVGMAVAVSQ